MKRRTALFLAVRSATAMAQELPALATLERMTTQPYDISAAFAMLCNAPKGRAKRCQEGQYAVQIYTSADYAEGYSNPWGKAPEGTWVVKEKLKKSDEGKFERELFTAMRKRETGYFPEGGDWEYSVADAAGKMKETGKLQSCAQCHAEQKAQDFLMRPANNIGMVPFTVPQLRNGNVFLHSSLGWTRGDKLRYEPQEKKNTFGFWVQEKDYLGWKFQISTPGKFQVHALQGCAKGQAGSSVAVELLQGEKVLQTLVFTVEDTGHFQNFTPRNLGELEIKSAGDYQIIFRPIKKAAQAVMDLRQVRLEFR
jgi:hypothetical protein